MQIGRRYSHRERAELAINTANHICVAASLWWIPGGPVMKTVTAVLLFLSCTVAVASAGERRFEKSFPVTPGGLLTISTDNGSIEVAGTNAKEVAVLAIVRGRQSDVDDYRVEAFETGKGVEVRGKGKSMSWPWDQNDLEVQFTVRVPAEYNVKLQTSGGNLVVGPLKGTVDGETSGGNIELKDVEGPVTMETSGGNVRIERMKGNVHVETSGGNITANDVTGPLNVNTSGGNITIGAVDGKITAETSGGDVAVQVKGTNRGVFVETSGGDIEIEVPSTMGATVDASTSGGEVTCDLPITMNGRLEESRMRGTINGGGEMIRARTSGGDIRIGTAGGR
jgi:DUF4097 and DUF4098 domain-containing protein YvlB